MGETKKVILSDFNGGEIASSKLLANNTVEINLKDGAKVIRYHHTDVVRFENGQVVLDSGGWKTKTTKEHLNRYSPFQIWQKKGLWSVRTDNILDGTPFYDGITFNDAGILLTKEKYISENKVKRMKKRIKEYTKKAVANLNNNIPWVHQDFNNIEVLYNLLKEMRLNQALLQYILRKRGYLPEAIPMLVKMESYVKPTLTRYLNEKLIIHDVMK